jgi:phage baseplate assembly protein gpV
MAFRSPDLAIWSALTAIMLTVGILQIGPFSTGLSRAERSRVPRRWTAWSPNEAAAVRAFWTWSAREQPAVHSPRGDLRARP